MKKSFINKEPADIISTLPDSLLSHILSFLPTKYAVGTSILSKRWRYLWVHVPHLEFDESQCFLTGQISLKYDYTDLWSKDAAKEYRDNFIEFVNRVLSVDDGPCLQKFCLRFESYELIEDGLLDNWISAAVGRSVREVEMELPFPEDDGFYVPDMLFSSENLVRLKLYGASLPRSISVYLPCLKVLILLHLVYDGDETMQRLFSGCPLLEELAIERCECNPDRKQDLSVLVPSLKRLRIGSNHYDYADDKSYKLVIDAPQLEYLDLTNFLSDKILLQNLRSLTKASITVGDNITEPASSSLILSELSNVKSLDANWVTEVGCSKLPTFHYLTQLKLGGEGEHNLFGGEKLGNKVWNFRLLGRFLECSPNLEVLTLEGGRHGSWRSPQQVPTCLLLHLSKISILHVAGEKHNLKMIRYLLGNAKVLKKMTIKCKHPDANFYKALTAIPKGSTTCQLRLLL